MARAQDIAVDIDNNPIIVNGDFVVQDQALQHVSNVLKAGKGSYVRTPQLGVGLTKYILDNLDPVELQHVINQELVRDGFSIRKLKVDNNYKAEIDGEY